MKYLILSLIILMFVACGKEKSPMPEPNNDMIGQANSGNPQAGEFGTFKLTIPDRWIAEEPENGMRVAQYKIQGSDDVKVLVFNFGEQAGTAEANIERWKNEFVEVKTFNESTLLNGKIKYMEATGRFKVKPFPMAEEFVEKDGYMTIAAIVPDGATAFYFKLNGPSEVVDAEKDIFKKTLESYKKK